MKPEFVDLRRRLNDYQPETAMLLETQGIVVSGLFEELQFIAEQRLKTLGMLQDDHELAKAFRKVYQEIELYKSLIGFVKECDVINKQPTHEVQS